MKAVLRLVSSLLLASPVAAAASQGAGSERGAFTDADLDLYVDLVGNDASDCTGPGASACATIQGALDKVPKRLRHVVTVTVASGNYAGFVVEGFEVHPAWRTSGAGMIIQGTTQPASLKTGTAAGAASSPCDGGGFKFLKNQQQVSGWVFDANVHSTLEDSNQAWTPHDSNLRGRKLCLTSGSGMGECLAIEDNDAMTITLAGYWSDFHAGWWRNPQPLGQVINPGCLAGDKYEITEPATHLKQAVSLPPGIGGQANGQGKLPEQAAIIVSNVHGGASATAGNGQPADNFQILLKDFDVLADDWTGGHVVHSVAYVDSSDHIGFKHFTTGINTLDPNQSHRGLYSGGGLFVFRNSTAWTVQSSYANGDAPTTPSSPMISCSRSATADTLIGVFGNVVDNMPAYFGDETEDQTACHSSVIFGGESIRNTGGDPCGAVINGQVVNNCNALATITIQSAALVHFVGTKIDGSRKKPDDPNTQFTADCIRLGAGRRVGFGIAYFEGGDFSRCTEFGINIAGNWIATFINNPTTSAKGPNGQFAIVAANGARVLGLGCASNDLPRIGDPNSHNWRACGDPGPDQLRGNLGDLSFDGTNHTTIFSYSDVLKAPGQTVTDPQRGGLFAYTGGEAISATSAVPPNWISFGQGVVYGFTSQSGDKYPAKNWDHVIGMSQNAQRTVTLPGKRPAGTHYIIIDTSGAGSADGQNTITVITAAGSINGSNKAVITPGRNRAMEVISDGANYWIISLQ